MSRAIALAYLLVFTWLLWTPEPEAAIGRFGAPAEWLEGPSYTLHFAGYLVLAVLLQWAFAGSGGGSVALVLAAAGLHAIVTEFAQRFIASRTFDLLDLAANLGGALAGAVVWQVGRSLRRPSQSVRGLL